MTKRLLRPFLLATLLVAFTAGTTLAHECYNTQRSERGNAGAAGSAAWEELTLADLFATAHEVFPIAPLTDAEVAEAAAMAEAAGVPSSVVILGATTIGAQSTAFNTGGKATDGKGIDWFFTKYGETLAGIAFEVGTPL
jgi:hypothetical protein